MPTTIGVVAFTSVGMSVSPSSCTSNRWPLHGDGIVTLRALWKVRAEEKDGGREGGWKGELLLDLSLPPLLPFFTTSNVGFF